MDGTNQVAQTIELSKSIIVDQGVAVGALIFLFIIVVLFIMILWRVLGNQRQENKDQGVLVLAVGNLVNMIEKFDKTASRFAEVIEIKDNQVSNDRDASNQTIEKGIAKIAANSAIVQEHTESVNGMKNLLETIEQRMAELVTKVDEITLSEADRDAIASKVCAGVTEAFKEAISDIAKLTDTETEAETVKLEKITDEAPGVPVTPKPATDDTKEETK